MRHILLTAPFLLLPLSAHAEAFCDRGSAMLAADGSDENIAKTRAQCAPGDVISFPPGGANGGPNTAKLCDFSRQIVILGGSLYCSLAPPKEAR